MNTKTINQYVIIYTWRTWITRFLILPAQVVLIAGKLLGATHAPSIHGLSWWTILWPLWLLAVLLAATMLWIIYRVRTDPQPTPHEKAAQACLRMANAIRANSNR